MPPSTPRQLYCYGPWRSDYARQELTSYSLLGRWHRSLCPDTGEGHRANESSPDEVFLGVAAVATLQDSNSSSVAICLGLHLYGCAKRLPLAAANAQATYKKLAHTVHMSCGEHTVHACGTVLALGSKRL